MTYLTTHMLEDCIIVFFIPIVKEVLRFSVVVYSVYSTVVKSIGLFLAPGQCEEITPQYVTQVSTVFVPLLIFPVKLDSD